uniref:Bab1_2 protein n=1 Tax=Fopius arisanus TaxID=64838 RepID=A0A0C9RNS5_9HYME
MNRMQEEAMLNLRWDLFSSQLATTLDTCYEKQYFVDSSLVCKDGTIIKCHKMVLANSSTFFRRILVKNDHPHPMIVLHDIDADDLKTIVNFMYCGEIEVVKSEVRRLLKIAEILEISGLKDIRSSAQFQKTYAEELAPFLPGNISEESKNPSKPYYFRRRPQEPSRTPENFLHKAEKVEARPISAPLSLKDISESTEGKITEKTSQKRSTGDNCHYLKKLRLLGEIDIIRCSDETSPERHPDESESPECTENYGVFIKNEIDIPFDVGNVETASALDSVEKIVKKKLSSGIEIFKAHPKGFIESLPGPSRSESLSPRSRNSVDSF